MSLTAPEISIILIVGKQRARAQAALESVLRQQGLNQAEIILVDQAGQSAPPLAGASHNKVRMFRSDSVEYGSLKAEAVHASRGRIVAFLEDHVTAHPGWLEGIVGSLKSPWVALGGEVHNANPGVGISDTMAVLNYGNWQPAAQAGETEWIPGNNSAYLRGVLQEAGDQLEKLLAADMVLQFWLKQRGYRFYLNPAVAISHLNETNVSNAVRAVFFYHWCFMAVRVELLHWPMSKRLLHFLLAPLIAWLRWFRLLNLMHGHNQAGIARSVLSAILLHFSVLGQNFGLLFGSEIADRAMVGIELDIPRPRRSG